MFLIGHTYLSMKFLSYLFKQSVSMSNSIVSNAHRIAFFMPDSKKILIVGIKGFVKDVKILSGLKVINFVSLDDKFCHNICFIYDSIPCIFLGATARLPAVFFGRRNLYRLHFLLRSCDTRDITCSASIWDTI